MRPDARAEIEEDAEGVVAGACRARVATLLEAGKRRIPEVLAVMGYPFPSGNRMTMQSK
jgi:hypothetical protein